MHEGQFVQVTCSVSDGDLPLTLEWYHNGKSLEDYAEVTTSKIGKRTSVLVIESVSHGNAGNYTCLARNDAGSTSYIAELHVNGY